MTDPSQPSAGDEFRPPWDYPPPAPPSGEIVPHQGMPYGQPPPQGYPYPSGGPGPLPPPGLGGYPRLGYPVTTPSTGQQIAAMVCGICGIVLVFIPLFIGVFLGLALGIPAIVFGGIGISKSSGPGAPGKGPAITGLVLGIVTILLMCTGAGSLY